MEARVSDAERDNQGWKWERFTGDEVNKATAKIKVSDLNRHFSKEDIQMEKKKGEKLFNIPNYQRNANQNYNDFLSHTSHKNL